MRAAAVAFAIPAPMPPRNRRADGTRLAIAFGGRLLVADVVRQGNELHVFARGRHRVLTLVDVIAQSGEHEAGGGRLTARCRARSSRSRLTPVHAWLAARRCW